MTLRHRPQAKARPDQARPERGLDVEALRGLLDGRWRERREATREIAARPEFRRPAAASIAEHRAQTLAALPLVAELAGEGWPLDLSREAPVGPDDLGTNLAHSQELIAADASLQVKAGVQWGLYAETIHRLGTERHEEAYRSAHRLETLGCFAMTEWGHGSDVASLATTATFDGEAGEFVVDTPTAAAAKRFLGNAAEDATSAVVFAKLVTRGIDHGVHALIVPIRDEHGAPLPGVEITDDGAKAGLNGVDNGQLSFNRVRVPRENLLNQYGDVDEEGRYHSPIESPGRRFFTMIASLVQGRIMLSGSALNAAQFGLGIATTYALERRQFSKPRGGGETAIMDYQAHQHRLLPLLAKTIAATLAARELEELFAETFAAKERDDDKVSRVETAAAGLKPYATWLALDALQECREALGGAGFIAANRVAQLRQDIDVFATFEGDNTVLRQLAGKRILEDHARALTGGGAASVGALVASRARALLARHTPIPRLAGLAASGGKDLGGRARLAEREVQAGLLARRAHEATESLVLALRSAGRNKALRNEKVAFEHQVELLEAAEAHTHVALEDAFARGIERLPKGETRRVAEELRSLFALATIEEHAGWYLSHGYLSPTQGRALPGLVREHYPRLRPHLADIVAAFGYDRRHWAAPAVDGSEDERHAEQEEHAARSRASAAGPVTERELRAAARRAKRR
ncbi:acyl-CoA dehydrogenase family protein [Corynebacterium otitidis]|uniref:acyl-CoA dehydrogenase family protein n=1 Tax=Corynebacterium otitidis TaxID=29321 RepID=UPI000627F697|nr:acyl-CoA dehydrogenase [Corynebacterium otitidis]KKO83982.1 hypothetical protein AAV33_03670 [Corynebacterium otitidis]